MKIGQLMILVPCLLLAACKTEDADALEPQPTEDFQSGLDRDAEVSELPESDVDAFCDDVEAYGESVDVEQAKRGACAFGALFFGGLELGDERVSVCQAAYDECLDSEVIPPSQEEVDATCTLRQVPSGCEATVGEVEDCVSATLDHLLNLATDFNCNNVDWNDPTELAPQACLDLQDC